MDVQEVAERAACLPLERLEADIVSQAGHLAAAECRWLLNVAEYDRRKGYEQWGCWSCAMWLGWKCGIARRSAQEKVRVARALEGLPLITEAFSKGELSYSQVRALTRVAEPSTEETLVTWARHATGAQLERLVRGYSSCLRRDEEIEEANARHERRYLRSRWDHDGSLLITARLDPEEGRAVLAALEAVEKVRSAERPAASDDPETRRADSPAAARRADAFVAMAETVLVTEPNVRSGGDRYLVVAHVDVGTLADDADGRCELEAGPALAPETARRLACDAGLVAMLDDADGNPLAVGRKTRTIPTPLRRALHSRDKGCRFPGCDRPVAEIHHVEHHARGGETCLANLIGLCWFHHHCVHEGGYGLELDEAGEPQFSRPDGTPIDPAPAYRAVDQAAPSIEELNAEAGLRITAETCGSLWAGDLLDLSLATDDLMWARKRSAERTPDETEDPSWEGGLDPRSRLS
jgi:hypothetical protein